MKKKWLTLLFILVVYCSNLTVYAEEDKKAGLNSFNVQAKSAILMEVDSKEVLMAQNEHEKLAPASITKLMTLYLIYEAAEAGKFNWQDEVSISEYAASMGGSQVFLEPYEIQTAHDLTKCIAISSANDAAVAMAEFVAGNEQAFVNAMNEKAKELGMKNTNFENSSGLDGENHYSSAYDIALLSRELVKKYPEVLELTQIWMDNIVHRTKRGEEVFDLSNTNKLLKWYNGTKGLKTGSTSKALYCLSAMTERNGFKLISVVLGAPDYKTRFRESMGLLDYGYANFGVIECEKQGAEVVRVKIEKGIKDTVSAVTKDAVNIMAPKGKNPEITHEIRVEQILTAPIEKDTFLGEIIYFADGKEMAKVDLVAGEEIQKTNFGHMIAKLWRMWVGNKASA